ncbi:MAG: aldo/keto reductase, partial [Chloroflexota bacterium]|nr:aldo/keto reductase [Chloroflexota bacterium]
MEYRVLGRTGAKVSTLCLGAMMFGDPADRSESHRMLDAAREAGVNFVDTANNYTRQQSETIVGEWFAQGDGRREDTFLATKVHRTVAPGPNGGGNHRYTVLQRVEES